MNKLGDRYVLLDQLGAGAMGVVWRARDELLHRDVAVKQLLLNDVQPHESHEAVQRAMREGRIAARLQHPNAIAVYDVVVEAGKPCLVMEYLPSKNLSAILDERGPLPPQEAARIGSLAASALAAAHEAGIVHRDIKPGNVLIGRDGAVKITDFGISRALGDVAVTKTGMLAGTPAYLAPELARGADPAPPSDMFSLGATIYAMTEGEPPFGKSTNDLGLLYKVARGETRPPVRSGPLTGLLVRMLSNEPSQRPTATQAAQELKAIASGAVATVTRVIPPGPPPRSGTAVMPSSGPGTQGPRTPPPRTRPPVPLPDPEPEPEPSSKNRGLAIAASILAVLLIAGIAYAIVQGNKSENNTADPSSTPVTTSETPAETSEKPAQNTPAPTSNKPTQTKPSPPPSTKPPATKFTPAQVVTFVKQHYAKLPKNPASARQDWNPDDAPQDYADDEYWKAYSKVVVKGNPVVTPAEDGTFTVVTALELTEAETNKVTTEEHTLTISGKGEKLLITGEERG
ncbi:serine/threonine-protein kinase [Lentzea sp. BCCO 10_0856]|uniref:non-specific serine/threonine protein kinase n=1 Tax=Lentzea miocenica TaxID=3095431 RepID=A0ABU4SYA6_9PSEU|nr:serine/threonine-protein kinase [Lentzea sp. BCCO 10_0856]MDX8030853.1 serine/threonine-protein kinase [Lentzea sp. BCCO 10_0856]